MLTSANAPVSGKLYTNPVHFLTVTELWFLVGGR